jgi:hypothetical protein
MRKYVFLDNWVLNNYTKVDWQLLLSDFIKKNNFTIIVNSLLFVEMYNPGWNETYDEDRTIRALRFLSEHNSIIINPEKVYAAEIEAYPNKLTELPIELNLEDLPEHLRVQTLLNFLRGDDLFIKQGKDIKQWAENYKKMKSEWLKNVAFIIEDACQKGFLIRDVHGNFIDLKQHKEEFLCSLDRRQFTVEQIKTLGRLGIQLFMGDTVKLPSTRLSSLLFWHAYIEKDKAYTLKKSGSDVGDLYQISLIPYCSAFTVDKTMKRIVNRIIKETGYTCEIFDQSYLEARLIDKY